jgi:hypothetical protein
MSSIRKLTAGTAVAALLALPALAVAQTPSQPPTQQQQPPSQPPATQPPTTQPPTTQPPATQPPTTQPPTEPAAPAVQTARRHLTDARNTLSELTQLPAASQLTGDTRTQVSQLISNFNELITTQSEWRASYVKVNANLTALIGPDPTAADPASGTTGAVGTTGTTATNLDPAIRAKLMEFRRQLSEFEKAAGGTATSPENPNATDPNAPATPPTTPPPSNPPTTPPATPPTTPPPTTPPTEPQTAAPTATSGAQANVEVMRHITAIEALLKTEDDSGGVTLTKAQLEQLRNHLALLRQSIDKK